MQQIRDAVEADLSAIVDIYNSTIPSRMVTGDLEPISVSSRLDWFHSHRPTDYPLWVMEVEGQIVAWLGFQPFYGRPAYRGTAEISLYVGQHHRRQGCGRQLLAKAIHDAPNLHIHILLGFIFGHNLPSLRLFEQMGFFRWGHLPQVAQLDGVKRDLIIVGRPSGSGTTTIDLNNFTTNLTTFPS